VKIRIPEKLRNTLGRKYLDWAEKLPKFGGGVIAMLQQTREDQRKQSEDAYTRSRPPQNTEIEYLYFRLIEMFHIEDCDQLMEGLLHLFPSLNEDWRIEHRYFLSFFRHQAGRISRSAYLNLGHIVREREGRLFAGSYREMSELPAEVDYIGVWLHKILPSVFVVTLDVHLTDGATQRLLELQNRYYLPKIRFKKLVPWGTTGFGYSAIPAEVVMRQEILGWLKRLRGKVEACIKPFVSGYFMQQSSDKIARLPVIEVYALRGIPEGKEPLNAWMKTARGWWESLGFSFYGYNTYSDGKILFVTQDTDLDDGLSKSAHRLVVLWKPYLASISTEGFGRDEGAVAHHTEYKLTAMLPIIAVSEFLEFSQRNIEKLRMSSEALSQGGFPLLDSEHTLNSTIPCCRHPCCLIAS